MAVKAVCHVLDIQYANTTQFIVRVRYLMLASINMRGDVYVLMDVPVLLNTFNLALVAALKEKLAVGTLDTVLLLNAGLL